MSTEEMFAAIDAAAMEVSRSLIMLREAQAGEKNEDIYGCALRYVELALQNAATDLKAVGAH